MTNLFRKTITGVENVIVDTYGNNTVAFLAALPKNAVVTGVIVNGEYVKDYAAVEVGVTVEYPRAVYAEGRRVAAVLRSVYDGNSVVDAAKNTAIESFVVEYIETAVAEV